MEECEEETETGGSSSLLSILSGSSVERGLLAPFSPDRDRALLESWEGSEPRPEVAEQDL